MNVTLYDMRITLTSFRAFKLNLNSTRFSNYQVDNLTIYPSCKIVVRRAEVEESKSAGNAMNAI